MKNEIIISDYKFDIKKIGKEWRIEYKNYKAVEGKTKKEVIEKLYDIDTNELIEACKKADETIKKNDYFVNHAEEFRQIFGFDAPRDYFLYLLRNKYCLDVIALDKKLYVPGRTSTHDYIKQKYGEHALEIVKNMI